MMRPTFLSCIVPLALLTMMASGQQTKPATVQQTAQQSAGKDSGAPSPRAKAGQTQRTHYPVARKRHSRAAYKHGAKRTAYRPEYTQNSVEVINGASAQKVAFHNDEASSGSTMNASGPMKVQVVNGTSTDTQYFAANATGPQPGGAEPDRPVVVGIQSSDTKIAGGNKHPVVTGITSSETGTAKNAAGGGDSVTKTVSPRPKRPVYQQDAH